MEIDQDKRGNKRDVGQMGKIRLFNSITFFIGGGVLQPLLKGGKAGVGSKLIINLT